MGKITFILGGARSGKSTYALGEANLLKGRKAFIATAEALDREMERRIARHKAERGPEWDTFEEPIDIKSVLKGIGNKYPVILIDCITLWVSNLLHKELSLKEEFESLVKALLRCSDADVYLVSNEVGMGVVPEYPLGRVYRDQLGLLNKMIASVADRVILMTAGIPVTIKGETGLKISPDTGLSGGDGPER
ncbi:MAG: bifunctional adenosylcobinamide kinase/adenosylcobinamide-phosphate guanylyltransferase [Syntrophobacterales bacterium]|jgi:adenosylcobinamide kinase/adenosylcobinamide-phosphate guanylyltransferase|nr:bifunctional adenosylcobinamide kinase/adenosylcobinamide-phosphate guanylyltransferase [Syntrophobacterales bacterium]